MRSVTRMLPAKMLPKSRSDNDCRDFFDKVDRREERHVPFQQLDRVSGQYRAAKYRRVVADEHEKRQRQHVMMSAAADLSNSGGVPVFIAYCTDVTASQLRSG